MLRITAGVKAGDHHYCLRLNAKEQAIREVPHKGATHVVGEHYGELQGFASMRLHRGVKFRAESRSKAGELRFVPVLSAGDLRACILREGDGQD